VPNGLIRSFVAVDLNNDQVLNNIVEMQQTLSGTGGDLKFVDPQNIHITLRFLGEIRQELIQDIIEQMKQIRFSAFNVEFRGLGVFPSLHRPRVVWIGIERGATELAGIFKTLEDRLRTLRIQPDTRGFSPHLTIARVRSGRVELSRLVSDMRDKEFGSISVNSVKLKKSTLTPSGPVYSDLYELQATSARSVNENGRS
jgi:2'-5' RNA ligase